ncbi:hypothetical protein NEOLEDRAFT_1145921 [Neolentinus lepideus HHB14362 ss-1]|uniref:Uncharacterized protein n=1 Tax=Neolentinus lepideus HHB14362 ss-1 TaxID=1314782 RepID=A0A165UKM5_9AGAM|nr:hypothetical protein NEOLEDRAFT_1145921 [Neolentinus lepideus HHB14362 ss-1]
MSSLATVNEKTALPGPTNDSNDDDRRLSSAASQNTASPMIPEHQVPPPISYGFAHHRNSLISSLLCFAILLLHAFFSTSCEINLIGISSAALGLSSCFDSPFRIWKLWRHWDEYAPLNDNVKWHMDSFMWLYSIALTIMAIPLAVSSALNPPLEDFFLMTTPMLVGPMGLWFFFSLYPWRLPFRISSDMAGTRIKPAVFYIIEDIGAVDARHGRPYRIALHERYHASPPFRSIMWNQTLFWAVGSMIYVGITAAVTWSTPFGFAFAFVLGQFFVWLLIWGILSVFLYSWGLKREGKWWRERAERGEKVVAQSA